MAKEIKGQKNKFKVIIVDDDDFLLDMYTVKFKESKFDVESFSSAVKALEKIREGCACDMILLDIVMPVMDGFEFLTIMQKENLFSDVKKIVLSNLGQNEEIQKALSLGAVDYIVKAYFTPTEIVKKVTEILKK